MTSVSVRVSVCMSVREHISGTTLQSSPDFLCMLAVAALSSLSSVL